MTTRIEYNDVAVKAYAGLHKLIEVRNSIQQHQLIVSGLTIKANNKLLESISEIIATQHEVIRKLDLVEESVVTS
jgi:predicted hotdog family 3-hydroxylacyl-ACP dehydratase